jgi:membrane protein DedA with SNARE-associated domain
MIEWIAAIVERMGYPGIAFLMFLENVFPPIPSELIMPMGGFAAARGEMSLVGVVLAGSAGSLAGALFWYGIGRWIGCERLRAFAGRHGAWLTISPREVDRAQDWFRHRGWLAVLIGRLVPGVRTLISVPAGIAEMPLRPFLLFSAIGTAGWSTLLATAGYMLEEHYHAVAIWLNPVATLVIAGLVGAYLVRLARARARLGAPR